MATSPIGASFSDFLTDLVGGDSNVKMAGQAAAAGFDPRTKDVLEQISAAIQKSKDAGPPDIAENEKSTLGDASKAAINYKNHLSLLNSLNDFYSKKFAPTTSGTK